MPGSTGPNLGLIWGFSVGENGWGIGGYNPSLARLDTIVHLTVISISNDPPGAPINGDRYIVGDTPTGDWIGESNNIAVYLTIGSPGWTFYAPKEGWRAFNIAADDWIRFNGTAWVDDGAGSAAQDAIDAIFTITTPAENDIFQYDDISSRFINVRPRFVIGFGGDPTAILTADQEVLNYKLPVGVTFLDNFTDYRGWSSTVGGRANTTAEVILVVRKATVAAPLTFSDVGTITIALGTTGPGTFATTGGDLSFAKNDTIQIRAPTSPDATFAGLFGTLVGFET
jgi:hypothetical protein